MSQTQSQGGTTTDAGGCCGGAKGGGGGCGCGSQATALPAVMTTAELEAVPLVPLVMRYRRGIEAIDRRVFTLSERQIDTAFLPDAGVGRWPVRVLVGHIADADVAQTHRMRRAAAEMNPVLSVWDEDAFVEANLYGNDHEGYADTADGDRARVMQALGGDLAVIHTLRQWTGQWVLRGGDAVLERRALHPERGEVTVRRMVATMTWHLEHHARFLTRKLDLMLGPAAAEATAGGSGCRGSA